MMKKYWNKIKVVLLLFAGGVLLLSGSCRKRCFKTFQFVVPFTVNPTNDTLKIGDTLWVKANFSDQMLDYLSGETL